MIKGDRKKMMRNGGQMGFILFVAYIGALIYFVQRNEGFGGFLLAFLQAAVWPAYVLHAVLGLLHV